jgi:hypothetical protein
VSAAATANFQSDLDRRNERSKSPISGIGDQIRWRSNSLAIGRHSPSVPAPATEQGINNFINQLDLPVLSRDSSHIFKMEDTDLWTEEKEDDLQGRIQKFDKGGEL